jgi:hypothetical protein
MKSINSAPQQKMITRRGEREITSLFVHISSAAEAIYAQWPPPLPGHSDLLRHAILLSKLYFKDYYFQLYRKLRR